MARASVLTLILVIGAASISNAQSGPSTSHWISLAKIGPDSSSLLSSAAVRKAIIKAFQLSGSGTLNVEFGFGVLRDETAGFATTEVSRGDAGLWRANLPTTTIAIFHTHRNSVNPRPSVQDTEQADRLQRPIYVISSSGLWVYEPRHKAGKRRECERLAIGGSK